MAETIATYDELSDEYDLETHETTRGLEQASLRGFASALRLIELRAGASVLELGCGSGLLTQRITLLANAAKIVASDPSPKMLEAAAHKLTTARRDGKSIDLIRATAREVLLMDPRSDLILASLADPFLDATIPDSVAKRLQPGGYTFFSVPSRAWAKVERNGRLSIHQATTRFRTRSGRELRARSQTYDSSELKALFETARLEILAHGQVRGPQFRRRPVPEASWVLARRSSLEDLKIRGEGSHDGEELRDRID
jgi:SAM-dependent methyltransferase